MDRLFDPIAVNGRLMTVHERILQQNDATRHGVAPPASRMPRGP
jgi:hypothetical protein